MAGLVGSATMHDEIAVCQWPSTSSTAFIWLQEHSSILDQMRQQAHDIIDPVIENNMLSVSIQEAVKEKVDGFITLVCVVGMVARSCSRLGCGRC